MFRCGWVAVVLVAHFRQWQFLPAPAHHWGDGFPLNGTPNHSKSAISTECKPSSEWTIWNWCIPIFITFSFQFSSMWCFCHPELGLQRTWFFKVSKGQMTQKLSMDSAQLNHGTTTQEAMKIGGTHHKAYVSGLCMETYLQNMAWNMEAPLQDPEDLPLTVDRCHMRCHLRSLAVNSISMDSSWFQWGWLFWAIPTLTSLDSPRFLGKL